MIHHPSILQNLNKFRVIKMLGFKTKELRRSARSCTELRGVDVEEGRTFSFCVVPSSRVAKVNRGPSLMGSTSENSSEIQSFVEKVQKKRQSRDGWRTCASFGSVPDADCEDRARGRPRTKPHLCEAKYHATGPRVLARVAVVYPGIVPCPQ